MNAAENARLTDVRAGSPMGRLLRSYWIPLCHSHELAERDGPPVRIRLLGESLIAFRDTQGRVGLLDHRCPHRGASLFYGRNEEEGIRCAYHGWKFDVAGRCLDMPNELGDCPLQRKVRATAYPCREANGVVWTYMGERGEDDLPPLPAMGWAAAPVERKSTLRYLRNCNWVQAMEGDFDSSHLGFLHSKLDNGAPAAIGDALRPLVASDRRPQLEVEDTEIGVMYAAARESVGDERYWRVTQFQLPFYTSVPTYAGLNRLKIWVPMDNEHTMIWEANWSPDRDLGPEQRAGRNGRVGPSGFLPDTDGWYGRGNFAAHSGNDYLLDRERQKTHNFTGMEDETPVQDAAMQESMGPIVDRTREHLSASDAAIIRMRLRLLLSADALEKTDIDPPGVDEPGLYDSHGEQMLVEKGGCWKTSFATLMANHYGREPVRLAAEVVKDVTMTVRNLSMRMLVPFCLGAASLVVPDQPVYAQAAPVTASANAAAASRLGVDPQLIEDLVVANRILAREGILDAYGHVSARHPTRPNHYLMARSVAPEFLTADDIIEYDLDSNPIAPTDAKLFLERFIHGEIYKARPDVQAVIHSHSAAVVPFSVSSVPLRPVFHMAAYLAGGVPVWDPASTNDPDSSGMLVRNPVIGASLAAALDKRSIVLLRGHGEVLVSRDIRHAVRNAIFTDVNARMELAAIQLGGTVKYVSPEEARAMTNSQGDPDRAWDYWKRRALSPK